MPDGPSVLSVLAAALYSLVVLSSLFALMEARKFRQPGWQSKVWFGIAIFFAFLIASRLFLLEDLLRADLRDWLRDEGVFAGRRAIQGPIIAIALGLLALASLAGTYWALRRIVSRRSLAVAVSLASCGAMLAVAAMRIISLHAMDFLLYGPLKLNWVGDLGASCLVIGSAAYYVLLVRGLIAPRKR